MHKRKALFVLLSIAALTMISAMPDTSVDTTVCYWDGADWKSQYTESGDCTWA